MFKRVAILLASTSIAFDAFGTTASAEILSFRTEMDAEIQLWVWAQSRQRWVSPTIRLDKKNSPVTTDQIDANSNFLVIRCGSIDKRLGWFSGRKLSEVSRGATILIETVLIEKEFEQTYTVQVPYTEQREGTRVVSKTVTEPIEETHTIMVPRTEEREGIRTIYKTVTEDIEETYTIMVPTFEFRQGRRIKVFHPETRARTVKVSRHVPEQVPYKYSVTLTSPETRTRTVIVTRQVSEQVPYTYSVTLTKPEMRTRTIKEPVLDAVNFSVTHPDGSREILGFFDIAPAP